MNRIPSGPSQIYNSTDSCALAFAAKRNKVTGMKVFKMSYLVFVVLLFIAPVSMAQRQNNVRPTASGGVLGYEQAAYDVKAYDIVARIDPKEKRIDAATVITAAIVSPVDWFVVDLDTPYKVSKVSGAFVDGEKESNFAFERRKGQIRIKLPTMAQPGQMLVVTIAYSGRPRVAPNPPWVGGFMWEKTPAGEDWIVNACQNDGADCWFPIKDHPSDEPDRVSLQINVPAPLYVASVGTLDSVVAEDDGTRTFNWKMSLPINNYNVVLNIAPYELVKKDYKSISGDTFPIVFYALPEHAEKARDIVDQTAKFVAFYEKYLGPFPFRSEKLGIAETPHLGMEHSTIIAYGNQFRNNEFGFDWLMLHELGHEWWGNMVTASDWRDMWIHEGFQTFMDSLYLEEISGKKAYLTSMLNRMRNTRNKQAVAPREPKIAYEIYMAAPDYTTSDGDIYEKGAVVLHTLRYLIGDKAFFRALRRMAYPEKRMETYSDGRQMRFATTDDFLRIAEQESGVKLGWFFEVYLRQPYLPELVTERKGNKLRLFWRTPRSLPFPMPVDVRIGGRLRRLTFQNSVAETNIPEGTEVVVDPEGWIFRKSLAGGN